MTTINRIRDRSDPLRISLEGVFWLLAFIAMFGLLLPAAVSAENSVLAFGGIALALFSLVLFVFTGWSLVKRSRELVLRITQEGPPQ